MFKDKNIQERETSYSSTLARRINNQSNSMLVSFISIKLYYSTNSGHKPWLHLITSTMLRLYERVIYTGNFGTDQRKLKYCLLYILIPFYQKIHKC